jgi:hypothetical protein
MNIGMIIDAAAAGDPRAEMVVTVAKVPRSHVAD